MNAEDYVKRRREHFDSLRSWEPIMHIPRVEELFDVRDPLFPLCEFLYAKCRNLYQELPQRKNGHDTFLHPINVVLNLKKGGVTDIITLLCGLMHDYIEEQVDLFKIENKLNEDDVPSKHILDEHELKLVSAFEQELIGFFEREEDECNCVEQIIETLKLLTRLKRDYYYKSISYIFNCPDPVIRERAIQVKLADRIHNILSIECFDERGRLYQCFKNMFIINSSKQFLIDTYGENVFNWRYGEHAKSTERLFTRCCKATYEAYLMICKITSKTEIFQVKTVLQLAFKKYKLEHAGIWAVTDFEDDSHPMRLFQGVIRKWDARLHHEWDEWTRRVIDEKEFCKHFFSEYEFTDAQTQAIIDYKDAYAMKEVIAFLLYEHEYVLTSFLSRQLDKKGRLKVANGNS
tara:strand:+ start:165 stop:1376 length:1212 start_codon:yes stop_codon:yes gene_type:complete